MSTIAAGTTTTNALVSTGNTDGTLQFQVNGTTPSVTLNTLGAVGVGSSPSYGTSGQVLTSGGSTAAPTWTTPTPVAGSGGATASGNVTLTSASSGAQSIATTTYGQIVTLPDATTMTKAACVFNISNTGSYPLKIQNSAGTTKGFVDAGQAATIGLADNSTAAGTWVFSNTLPMAITGANSIVTTNNANDQSVIVQLDSSRDLYVMQSAGNAIFGIVFNRATQTWGTNTTIRSATGVGGFFAAIKSATDQVLVASSSNATAFEAVVLTISGTTITVGTAATATLSNTIAQLSNSTGSSAACNYLSFVQVGSSYVLSYTVATAGNQLRAMTISGTTVTIGSATTQVASPTNTCQLYAVSSSVMLALYGSTSTSLIYATPYTISGTTITAGTGATTATSYAFFYFVTTLGSRWAFTFRQNSGVIAGAIVSVSGTTATISASALTAVTGITYATFCTTGTRVVAAYGNSLATSTVYLNAFADNAGTISVGTQLSWVSVTYADPCVIPTSTTSVAYAHTVSGNSQYFYTIDATSVTLTKTLRQISAASTGTLVAQGTGNAYNASGNPNVLLLGTSNAVGLNAQLVSMLGGKFPFAQTVGGSGFQFVKPPIAFIQYYALSSTGSYMVGTSLLDSANLLITVIEAAQ